MQFCKFSFHETWLDSYENISLKMAERLSQESRFKARRGLPRNGEGGQMQNLLGEFKGLYEGRLKRLEEADKNGEENMRVSFFFICINYFTVW